MISDPEQMELRAHIKFDGEVSECSVFWLRSMSYLAVIRTYKELQWFCRARTGTALYVKDIACVACVRLSG